MTMHCPVLFLDIDDVLCLNKKFGGMSVLRAFKQQREPLGLDFFPELWESLLDDAAVLRLRRVHAQHAPIFVLSTSWTRVFTREQLVEVLYRTGCDFVAKNLHPDWATPKGPLPGDRDVEICGWLKQNPQFERNWVVLDDVVSGETLESSILLPEHEFIILCEEGVGLTDAKALQLDTALTGRNG